MGFVGPTVVHPGGTNLCDRTRGGRERLVEHNRVPFYK